ncbi:MAG: DsbA family oxidoreductase [Pseudomonadota bacterium]|nr:DsbA family oxidoreductase [Pseudomonadota bacterium]
MAAAQHLETGDGGAIAIDVVSDIMCPWCYIGKRRLERAVAAMATTAVDVHWRPFQLDASIPKGGIPREEYLTRKFGSPDKIREIQGPVIAAGAQEGIDFRFDLIRRSPNTIDAHRLLRRARAEGLQGAIAERLFQLYFLEGADVGDGEVLAAAARECGMQEDLVHELLSSDAEVDQVEMEIAQASRMGITGVPMFVIGGRYAVVGAQDSRYIAGAIARVRADQAGVPSS